MKIIILMANILLLSLSIQAQILDSTVIVCQYKAKTIKVTAQGPMEDLIRLEIGKDISKSYSVYTARSDSSEMAPDYRARLAQMSEQITALLRTGVDLDEAIERSGMLPVCDLVVIYKNFPKGKMTVLDRVNDKQYKYLDETNSQKWEMRTDTLHILGYVCQKAVTEWRGRKYEAWFATEIPISEGPMKFGGLPGLIFKLHDEKREYCYEMEGIEKKVVPIKMDVPVKQKNFVETTRKKFVKAKRNYLRNFGLVMASETGINVATDARIDENSKYDLMETDL